MNIDKFMEFGHGDSQRREFPNLGTKPHPATCGGRPSQIPRRSKRLFSWKPGGGPPPLRGGRSAGPPGDKISSTVGSCDRRTKTVHGSKTVTLRTRFILFIAGVVLITVVAYTAALLAAEAGHLKRQAEAMQWSAAEHLSRVCGEAALTTNELTALNFFKELRSTPYLLEAMCVAPSGTIWLSLRPFLMNWPACNSQWRNSRGKPLPFMSPKIFPRFKEMRKKFGGCF